VSMRGSLDLIRKGAVSQEQAQELLEISQTEALRMLRLIDDLLDLKKIEEGQLKLNLVTVDPPSIVARAIHALSGMTLECKVEMTSDVRSTKLLRCDEDRILQVLTNLLSNAIKFSPAGSPVSVAVEDCRLGVRFSITDKGPGIPHKELQKLFHKFQQISTSDNRYSGSGLGLAISKSIVEQHGGKIGVDSKVGTGSTIWFELRTL
jgi:signal transduction histidine kinase